MGVLEADRAMAIFESGERGTAQGRDSAGFAPVPFGQVYRAKS